MSMTSELIEELQKLNMILSGSMVISPKMNDESIMKVVEKRTELISSAIDIIKTQSEKLHAYAMERNDQYYNGGWISCDNKLPEFGKNVLVSFEFRGVCTARIAYAHNGTSEHRWYLVGEDSRYSYFLTEAKAWRPLPAPYEKEDTE